MPANGDWIRKKPSPPKPPRNSRRCPEPEVS
jgi:hypothetical protein